MALRRERSWCIIPTKSDNNNYNNINKNCKLQNRTLKSSQFQKHIDWKYKTPWNYLLYYMDADLGQLENTINPG